MDNIQKCEVVQNLFGSNVGPVLSSNRCSHERISGRLYVASNALCFYSNILGFERKLMIRVVDITFAGLTRSTSIVIRSKKSARINSENTALENQIGHVFEEEHVFRSFRDREALLQVLIAIVSKSQTNNSGQAMTKRFDPPRNMSNRSDFSNCSTRSRTYSDPSHRYISNESRSDLPNRIRGASTPDWNQDDIFSQQSIEQNYLTTLNNDLCEEQLTVDKSTSTLSIDQGSLENIQNTDQEFDNAKRNFETSYRELAIDCHHIHKYSLDDFYSTFLSDSAPRSIKLFQENFTKDTEVIYAPWTPVSQNASYQQQNRTITFLHRRKSKIGPSQAQTTRHQVCTIFASLGIVISNVTKFEGVPYSDCFQVEDEWVIEPSKASEKDGGVTLSVRFTINFVKSTMMKKIISKSTKAEVKEWFKLYLKFVLTEENDNVGNLQLSNELNANDDTGSKSSDNYKEKIWKIFEKVGRLLPQILYVLSFVTLLFQVRLLHWKIERLEILLQSLKVDNAQIINTCFVNNEQ